MRRFCSPRIVVPLVGGGAVIAFLLGYANVGQVMRTAGRFQPAYLLLLLVLMAGYQALRAAQWSLLVRALDRREQWRTSVMAYMGGELAKGLPGGQYVQAYLLRQARGTSIASSVAATTIILWLEVVVCLVVVVVLGVGPWTWVRPAVLVLLGGIVALGVAVKRHEWARPLSAAGYARGRLRTILAWCDSVAASAGTLLRPRTLGPATTLSAAYILVGTLFLWTIATALGATGIGIGQAAAVYAFALAASLVVAVPIDLGLTELSGVAALMVFGVPRAEAVAIMLMQRVLSSALTALAGATTLALLRRQVSAALHGQAQGLPPAAEHRVAA